MASISSATVGDETDREQPQRIDQRTSGAGTVIARM
jgi:hypothetical protein